MESHSMAAGFVSSLPKEMTAEVTGIEGEVAGIDEIGEIVIEEGKYLMENSSVPTTDLSWKISRPELLGRI